jgi:hypothetical protein
VASQGSAGAFATAALSLALLALGGIGFSAVSPCRAVTHDYSVDLAQPQPLGSWTEHRRGEHQGDRPGEKSVRGIAEVHLVCVHIDPLGAQSPPPDTHRLKKR